MAMTAAQLLEQFLSSGGGNVLDGDPMQANDDLQAAGLRHSRDMENRERMVHDPDNKSWQLADQFIQKDEAADPYSQTNSEKRMSAEQSALDAAHNFFMPQSMKMREQGDAEKGRLAFDVSQGTHGGDYSAEVSPTGTRALDAASGRRVTENAAKVKPAAAAIGPINWPAGTAKYRPESAVMPAGWQGPQQSVPAQAAQPDQPQAHNAAGALDPTDTPDVKALFDSQGVDDGGRATVRSILNYDYPVPVGMPSARSPELQKYLKLAEMIDPNFHEATYASSAALRKSMTSGPIAEKIRSLQALSGHVEDLEGQRKNLNNSNFMSGAINPFMNWMESHLGGSDAATNYDQVKALVDAETGKYLASSNVTNELRNSLSARVNSNSSDQQMKGFDDTRIGLLGPQDEAIRAELSTNPRLGQLYDQVLTPRTKATLEKARAHSAGQSAAPAPGTRRTGAR